MCVHFIWYYLMFSAFYIELIIFFKISAHSKRFAFYQFIHSHSMVLFRVFFWLMLLFFCYRPWYFCDYNYSWAGCILFSGEESSVERESMRKFSILIRHDVKHTLAATKKNKMLLQEAHYIQCELRYIRGLEICIIVTLKYRYIMRTFACITPICCAHECAATPFSLLV